MILLNNNLIRPILALTLLAMALVGCGKKDSNNDAFSYGGPVLVAPNLPPPSSGDYFYWCRSQGGEYSSSLGLCRITSYQDFGWNRYWGSIDTGIAIYVNDKVSIQTGGSPKVFVGGANYGVVTNFTSHNSGTLALKGHGSDSFKIKSIQVSRCFTNNGYSAACP